MKGIYLIHCRNNVNSHSLKILIAESVPKILGALVFEKWVKQCHENTFLHAKIMFSWLLRRKLFSLHCFTNFSKTTAPQQVIFSGKLSTIIIFKLFKFNGNLWTLCFVSYKKYPDPLKCLERHWVTVRAIYEATIIIVLWNILYSRKLIRNLYKTQQLILVVETKEQGLYSKTVL